MERALVNTTFRLNYILSIDGTTLEDLREPENLTLLKTLIVDELKKNELNLTSRSSRLPLSEQLEQEVEISPKTVQVSLNRQEIGGYNILYLFIVCRGVIKRQVVILVTNPQKRGVLALSRCDTRYLGLIWSHLTSKMGQIVRPISITSAFTTELFDKSMQEIPASNIFNMVGSLHLNFTVETIGNSLKNIIVDIPGDVLEKCDSKSYVQDIYARLKKQLGIDLSQLELTTIRSNIFMITNTGRIRFNQGTSLDRSDKDTVAVWTMIDQLYTYAERLTTIPIPV
ncbi:BA75_05002T0 [Komagataella pastoris]|uniref:BA75_05002T0 n=1 Tax=Komagataella pastoris TaxID=4922 RepID=A0A1B2JJ90_PICPA|nr:BA75_05002T0 [Komagataella pastoris]